MTVTAKSDVKEYQTSTASDGTYEFFGLPSGRYVITLKPPATRETGQEYSKDVGSGTACRADFQLDYQGQISGSVGDQQGHGVSGIISTYSPEVGPGQSLFWAADVIDGNFVLKRVSPGRYKLRFLLKTNGRIQSRFIEFPGEVEIGDATIVQGLQFKIP